MTINKNENRKFWVDYLRSAITVLVVAHHSSLAYTTFANFDKKAYINSTAAIVDTKRWIGFDIFENYNDIFFMFLMFLIGGLFLSKSIAKKGTFTFIKDRFYRLFIPFFFGGTLLMLIAYFPSYYVAHNNGNIINYIKDFFTIEHWPVGAPWFIWVLFAFNFLFAISYPLLKKQYAAIASKIPLLETKPFNFFLLLFIITWLLYVPMAYNVGAGTWGGFGPFDVQLSRVFAYFGYFMVGVLIGGADFNNQLFSVDSKIVKKWRLWVLLSLIFYICLTLNGEMHVLRTLAYENKITAFAAWMIYYTFYVMTCVTTCIAFITIFRNRVRSENAWLNSLSRNAYLIYLIHYAFVTWTQASLLNLNIPALFKFIITFVTALALSWGLSNLLRRINIINKYL